MIPLEWLSGYEGSTPYCSDSSKQEQKGYDEEAVTNVAVSTISEAPTTRRRSNSVSEEKPPKQIVEHELRRTYSLTNTKRKEPKQKGGLFNWLRNKPAFDYSPMIKTSTLTKKRWERRSKVKLEEFAQGRESEDPNHLVQEFAKQSVNTTTIIKRIKEVSAHSSLSFLEKFSKIKNPKAFIKAVEGLRKEDKVILMNIIGGDTALNLLKNCLDNETQKSWINHLNQTRQLIADCKELERFVISFTSDFDKEHRVSNISHEDVRETFRSLFDSNPDIHCFKLNEISLTMPKFEEGSDSERKVTFFEWLIRQISDSLPNKPKLASREQAKLVCEGVLKMKKINSIKEKLDIFLNKRPLTDFQTMLDHLKREDLPEYFLDWAKEKLADFLYIERPQDLEILSREIIARFQKDYTLKFLKSEVPSYTILQSISFSAYFPVPLYLMNNLPSLFSGGEDLPKMKSFSNDPTRYEFNLDSNVGQFEATQVKLYRFYRRRSDNKTKNLGKVEVCWTVSGNIASKRRSAKLSFRNFTFDPRVDIATRSEIIRACKEGLLGK
ncbi:MAG: hypothetical protein JJU12_06175 [Chlamydiales bacterium]|nr:hypothetical protein [Chlamydiales bacterium]